MNNNTLTFREWLHGLPVGTRINVISVERVMVYEKEHGEDGDWRPFPFTGTQADLMRLGELFSVHPISARTLAQAYESESPLIGVEVASQ